MGLLLFVGLSIVVITLIYIYLKRRFVLLGNGVPGMEPQIFLGNLLNSGLLSGKVSLHGVMHDYQRRYGDKFLFWFGSKPNFVFCLPEHAKTIFTDRQRFEQSPLFLPNFDLICPANITILTGERYKRHARIMLPAFKRAKVIRHIDTIIECTDQFIDQYLTENEIHTNLVDRCQSLTMNVIGFIGFDYDLQNSQDSSSKVALQDFIFHVMIVMLLSVLPRWMVAIYIKLNWKLQRTHRKIRELMKTIVEQEENNRDTTEQKRPNSLIASLVSSLNEDANDEHTSSGITRAEMFDEVILSIIAGFETTSSAIAWFIFFMSKYPHVQGRIKQELREHDLLMTNDVQCVPAITPEKLDELVYCECVTKEVLRLAPIAGLTTRIALCDTEVDGVRIPCGETIIVSLHNITTDKRFWHHDDPMKFIPERFVGEDKDHDPYAMVPFGGGHRGCIGKDLAWLELKLVIIRLMQRGITFEDTPENLGRYEDRLACFPKKMAVRVRIDRQ